MYINYALLGISSLLLLLHSDCFATAQLQLNSEVVSCFPWFLLSSTSQVRPGKTGAGKRREILSPLNEKAASPLDNGIYVFFGYMSQSVWPFSGGFNCAFVVFCGFLNRVFWFCFICIFSRSFSFHGQGKNLKASLLTFLTTSNVSKYIFSL